MIKLITGNALLSLFLSFVLLFAHCSGPKSDQTETVATESSDVEVDSEDENPPEDKSKRPSPPAQARSTIGDLVVTIDYAAPAIKGRTVWGGLVSFGEVWRTGANEATVFEINKNARVNGESLAAGKYALFTIPTDGEWIIIFNTVWDQWGAFNYEEEKDVLRISVPTTEEGESQERMEFLIDDQGQVRFQWDKLSFSFTVEPA